ncbi:hypothetical protein BDW75DRAFT_224433 [Aspergillus navahoensis]
MRVTCRAVLAWVCLSYRIHWCTEYAIKSHVTAQGGVLSVRSQRLRMSCGQRAARGGESSLIPGVVPGTRAATEELSELVLSAVLRIRNGCACWECVTR